ncbi:hypothetical protein HanXRQr2_Chr09g0380331 [Helianthus annuus]|uniref:Uncharacterized protein n=1 Tax=Helianthus annuus TaxID=4232 RepID=A0A9K3I4Z1_HELAN|nr:hypothetical protein HanXRQr2_Chr09g0380331 [Helianthus annuus]
MKVSIYSRRGVRGCGLMGLGPETDNNEYTFCLAGLDCLVASRCSSVLAHLDWSHVSLLSALLSLLSSADKWRSWDSCPRLLIGAM